MTDKTELVKGFKDFSGEEAIKREEIRKVLWNLRLLLELL